MRLQFISNFTSVGAIATLQKKQQLDEIVVDDSKKHWKIFEKLNYRIQIELDWRRSALHLIFIQLGFQLKLIKGRCTIQNSIASSWEIGLTSPSRSQEFQLVGEDALIS